MARFRRRTCIILLLFILFICSIMMALKTLRPDRAGFGDPFGLGLLPELQQRTELLESKRSSLNKVQGDTVTQTSNMHAAVVNTMKASIPPANKLEGELSSPNYNFHVFYYSWFGNPQFDGKYIHWNHPLLPHWDPKIANNYPKGRHNPPEDIAANFYPELGSYSSKDTSVIEAHMKQMLSASIGVIALSWYPPGMADENGEPTDDLVPIILDYASKYNLKVTFHIEPYKDRDDRSMYHNVKYIIDKNERIHNDTIQHNPLVRFSRSWEACSGSSSEFHSNHLFLCIISQTCCWFQRQGFSWQMSIDQRLFIKLEATIRKI